jgi:hypothetical protein
MACTKADLADYLSDFGGNNPMDAIACPFVQGTPITMATFSIFFFGAIGLSLTAKTRHPSPVIVASMLSAGVVATSVPGIGAKLMALALVFGIAGAGLIIYKRAASTTL